MRDLDLPRGEARELVVDRDRVYELNGEDSRALAAVGAFRVVPEWELGSPRDETLDRDTIDHLRDEGLIRTIPLNEHDQAVVLTDDGRDLLEANRRERDEGEFAGVLRRREPPARTRSRRPPLRRLSRGGSASSRGARTRRGPPCRARTRPQTRSTKTSSKTTTATAPIATGGRTARSKKSGNGRRTTHCRTSMIACTSRTFVSIYEIDGRERHQDVEVLTQHYRGGHAVGRAQTGFRLYSIHTGGGGRSTPHPRLAEEFL